MSEVRQHFIKNAWYMAAWESGVNEGLIRRRILGQPIVIYRLESGAIAALTDRCPHRFAPLSQGSRVGDEVRCPYHGLGFDSSGACVFNPFATALPKGAHVRSWPTVVRDGIVWLWAGDADVADPALIPDFSKLWHGFSSPPITSYTLMKANYEFGTDNLMDLSHIEFVHRGSFAGAGVIFAGRHEVIQDGETIRSNWWMPEIAAPAHTFGIYPREMQTDHWLDMRWNAPASMQLEIGATPVGGSRAEGVIVQQAHILTPETEETTHYFWASSRSSNEASVEGDAMLRGLLTQAIDEEDKRIIEMSYANLDGADFWSQRPVSLGIDAGGSRARRQLQKMIEREAAVYHADGTHRKPLEAHNDRLGA